MGGIITALRVQKRNKNRVNVYLDGRFAFGLAAIEAVRLRCGQTLSDEDIAALKARDEVEQARQHTLGLLERRPRSVQEIRRYLEGKGYLPETIEAALASLSEAGLLDDQAFARFWLENRTEFRPRSVRALRQELRQKGVSAEVITTALQAHNENEAAYRAAQTQARRWRGLDSLSFRKKMEGFLVRRGFAYEVAREATARAWQEMMMTESDDSFDEME